MKTAHALRDDYVVPGTVMNKVGGKYLTDWNIYFHDDRLEIGRSYIGTLEDHTIDGLAIAVLKLMHDGNYIRRHDEILEEAVSAALNGDYKLLCRNTFDEEIYFVTGDDKKIDENIHMTLKDDRMCYSLGPAILGDLLLRYIDGKIIADGDYVDRITSRVAKDLGELNKSDNAIKRIKLCATMREAIEDLAFQLDYKRALPRRARQFGSVKGITTVMLDKTVVNIAETSSSIDTKFVFFANDEGKPITGIVIGKNHYMYMASHSDKAYAQDISCLIGMLNQAEDVIVL